MNRLGSIICVVAMLFGAFGLPTVAADYRHSGVYGEEIPSLAKPPEGLDGNTPPLILADNRPTGAAPFVVGPGMQRGKNYPGSDYKHIDKLTPAQCQATCRSESQCKAWTWVQAGVQGPTTWCHLKNAVPAESANACCISGVKTQVPGVASRSPKATVPVQPKAATVPRVDQQALRGAPSAQVLSPDKAPATLAARPSSRIENRNVMAQQPLQIGTASLPAQVRTGLLEMSGIALPQKPVQIGLLEVTGVALPAQVRTDPLEISGVALPREPLQIKTGSLEVTGLALPVQLRTDSLEMSGIGLPLQLKTAALEVTGFAVPTQLRTMALEVTGMGVPARLETGQLEVTGVR
jgi:PAN domain